MTVLIDGETGEGLGVVKRRDAKALAGFFTQQGARWCRGVKVVVTDGSPSYRAAIRRHLPGATHVVDRFHVARWFAAGLIEVRRRIQRIGDVGSRPAFDLEIFRSRYLQLTRLDRLDTERIATLGRVLARNHPARSRLADAPTPLPPSTTPPTTKPPTRRSERSSRSTTRHRSPSSNPSSEPSSTGATKSSPTTTPTGPPTAASKAPMPSSASPERIASNYGGWCWAIGVTHANRLTPVRAVLP